MLYPEGVKVIVKPETTEEMTGGGIIIPPSVREQHDIAITRGELLCIGPKAEVVFAKEADGITKRSAKTGDKVVYARYGGAELAVKAKSGKRVPLRVLNDEDVIIYDDGEEWDI